MYIVQCGHWRRHVSLQSKEDFEGGRHRRISSHFYSANGNCTRGTKDRSSVRNKRCVEYHSSSQCHVSSSSSASSKTNGHPPPTDRSPWRPSSQPIPRYIERGDKFLVSRAPPPSLKDVPDWRRTGKRWGERRISSLCCSTLCVGNEGAAGGYFRPS